ncbi:MAG: hypothetical protein AAF596_03385, partial [Planctomycetota bacterium]
MNRLPPAAMQQSAAMASNGAGPTGVSQTSFDPSATAVPQSTAELFAAVDPATGNPAAPPTREEAFAAILPDLQQLAAVNPAAQQKLLADMQTAEPAHWPLLVRRVKADLAVHARLAGDTPTTPDAAPAPAARQAVLPAMPQTPRTATPQTATPTTFDPPPMTGASAAVPGSPIAANTTPPDSTASRSGPSPSHVTAAYSEPPAGQPTAKLLLPDDNSYGDNASGDNPPRGGSAISGNAPHADAAIRLVSNEAPLDAKTAASMHALDASSMGSKALSASTDWRAALQRAIADLDADAPHQPQSAGEAYQHARLRLMQLAAGDLDAAASAIPGL